MPQSNLSRQEKGYTPPYKSMRMQAVERIATRLLKKLVFTPLEMKLLDLLLRQSYPPEPHNVGLSRKFTLQKRIQLLILCTKLRNMVDSDSAGEQSIPAIATFNPEATGPRLRWL